MAKLVLSDVANFGNNSSAVATTTANNDAIEVAIENTLSRDGTSPNEMQADLDMNSNNILNLPRAASSNEPVRKAEFDDAVFSIMQTSSTSSLTIALGSVSFETAEAMGWTVGQRITLFYNSNPDDYMSGPITAISGTDITLDVDTVGGGGTHSSWFVYQSGAPGPTGFIEFTDLVFTFDGNGVVLPTTAKFELPVTFDLNITEWVVVADQSGSISFDLWVDSLANYPPTIADTIVNTHYPSITSAQFNSSSSLTGWTTTAIAADSVITAKIRSCSSITRATLVLKATRG